MSEQAKVPNEFTHSIKLSETAKGIRIDVHVYANSQETAIFEAVETYLNTKRECEARNVVLAPLEVSKK